MSIRCQSWVYENSEERGNDRLVLLAIADEADDDGTNAHPGIDRIGHKARVPKRTTMRCIDRLEKSGALLVRRPETRGRGHFNTYVVVMGNGATSTPFEEAPERREKARKGAPPYLERDRPIDPLTQDPQEEPFARQRRRSRLPDPFTVSPAMQQWASEKWPQVDWRLQTQQFADHHRGKGTLAADWEATWRTWIRNAGTRFAPRVAGVASQPTGMAAFEEYRRQRDARP